MVVQGVHRLGDFIGARVAEADVDGAREPLPEAGLDVHQAHDGEEGQGVDTGGRRHPEPLLGAGLQGPVEEPTLSDSLRVQLSERIN